MLLYRFVAQDVSDIGRRLCHISSVDVHFFDDAANASRSLGENFWAIGSLVEVHSES